ncbi:flaD [Acrasis kona]|uniref:FlaD n=1 Tax=Acrasis kona TaxID=1008807 RepID=A0AAW2ZQM9_9EUKA
MESDVATLLERTPEGDTSPAIAEDENSQNIDEQNTAEELNKNSLPGESPAKINPTTVVSSFATYPLYIIISMVIRIILGYAQVVNHMPLQAYSFCIILLTAWSAMDTYANIVKIIRLKISSSTEEGTISAKITKEFYEKDGGLSIIFFSLLSFAQCLMIIIVVSFGVTNIGSSPVTVILAVLASIPNFIQKSLLPSDVVPNIQTTLPDNDRE